MPPTKLHTLSDALLNLLWREWHEVGGPAARQKSAAARSIIDPEALALCSLAMVHREPRLGDALASWCGTNSEHLSVQRMNNLARDYPTRVQAFLPGLAQIMVTAGKDLRWRKLAGATGAFPAILAHRSPKQSTEVSLDHPAAFLLRMRAVFGLGLRADIIVFLLRKRDPQDYSGASEIARAVGYNRTAVKRSLDILAAAGAVSVTDGVDPGYSIGWTRTFDLLAKDVGRLPHWKYAHQTFLWVLALLENADELATGPEFLRDLALGRLLRHHLRFLTSESDLFQHSELKRTPSLESVAAATTLWVNDL